MTKWAINVMGVWEDKEDNYDETTIEHLFEQMGNKFEPMRVTGVAVKQLPAEHIVISKQKVKKRDRLSLRKKNLSTRVT